MKCKDSVELINSYFDNKLDPMNDKLLAEHIASCTRCRAELEFLIKYKELLETVKPVSTPDNFISELHRKIEVEAAENPIQKFADKALYFIKSFQFPMEAAGVLAVAAVVFFLYKPFYNERVQKEKGIIKPFKKKYIVNIMIRILIL